jgi:hypothetical protein
MGKTHKEYLLGCQKLTEIQETRLVALLIEMDQCGLRFDHNNIRLYALAILNSKKKKGSANLGQNWVLRFLDQHHTRNCPCDGAPLSTSKEPNHSHLRTLNATFSALRRQPTSMESYLTMTVTSSDIKKRVRQ